MVNLEIKVNAGGSVENMPVCKGNNLDAIMFAVMCVTNRLSEFDFGIRITTRYITDYQERTNAENDLVRMTVTVRDFGGSEVLEEVADTIDRALFDAMMATFLDGLMSDLDEIKSDDCEE